MRLRRTTIVLLLVALSCAVPSAAPVPSGYQFPSRWTAQWIRCPGAPRREFGVYYFRKAFTLDAAPMHFVIHASADNRYELFVNGARLLTGPAVGDLDHWRYETLDIAPHLHAGRNALAAVVWNFAELAPMAQISNETAFILQGEGPQASVADTGAGWKVQRDRSIGMIPLDCNLFATVYPCTPPPAASPGVRRHLSYMAVGPGQIIDAAAYPWGWEQPDYDDASWQPAEAIIYGGPRELFDTHSRWMLMARNIPAMELTPERLVHVRRYTGPAGFHPDDAFLAGHAPVTLAANSHATVLLDQTYETTAYPELLTSGGRGAQITVTYAEALFDDHQRKGNRNDVERKHIEGFTDQFLPDGGNHRLFRPLDWRAYRYVQLDVTTAEEPLTLDDYRADFTAYPFTLRAQFESDDPELAKIWDIGWRALRLCSHETFMDCPYYERLQYTEDTRWESLIALYLAGDDRLVKNAIECLNESRTSDGLTLSRYPAWLPRNKLPFALCWIDILHDFWWYRGDTAFLRPYLPSVRDTLTWFEAQLDAQGLLPNPLPWMGKNDTVLLSLEMIDALRNAADLESAFGNPALARHDRALAARMSAAAFKSCWNSTRRLLADAPGSPHFSQAVNAFGVLTDVIPPVDQRRVIAQALSDPAMAGRSYEFLFHTFRAMKKVGLADEYVAQLQPWRDMLARGLTTTPEYPEPNRSDCHAWSAHPDFDLLATVAGIEPAAPGFRQVAIEPHLGPLQRLKATLPLPVGNISVEYERQGNGLAARVTLPAGLTGSFTWKGQSRLLHPGEQELKFWPACSSAKIGPRP